MLWRIVDVRIGESAFGAESAQFEIVVSTNLFLFADKL
jgi:hypothetical protein